MLSMTVVRCGNDLCVMICKALCQLKFDTKRHVPWLPLGTNMPNLLQDKREGRKERKKGRMRNRESTTWRFISEYWSLWCYHSSQQLPGENSINHWPELSSAVFFSRYSHYDYILISKNAIFSNEELHKSLKSSLDSYIRCKNLLKIQTLYFKSRKIIDIHRPVALYSRTKMSLITKC